MKSILCASTILSTILGLPAFAADQQVATVNTNDSIFNVRLGAAYVDMDVANGLGTVIDQADFTFIAQPDNGADISAVGGELSGDYWRQDPGFGGIYLGASILGVSDDNDFVLTLPGPFLDTLPIDGTISPGSIVTGIGAKATASTDVDFYRIAASAGYAVPSITEGASLAVGLYGGYSRLSFDAETRSVAGTGFATLSEDVKTVSVGPMVAFHKTLPLTATVEGFVEGQAALLYSRGNFDASQLASNIAQISLSSHKNDIAGMVDARAGVSVLAFGGGKLSLFGGLGVRNDVYKIVNPRSAPGLDNNEPSSYNPGRAHIEQTVQFSVSVGTKFAIQF